MFQEILQGGNSGGGSTETVTPLISSKVLGNTGDNITLSDDMTKYKYIDFLVSYNEISNGNYHSHRTVNRIPLYLIQKCLDDKETKAVYADATHLNEKSRLKSLNSLKLNKDIFIINL